jgi:hypothetical protein
VHLPSKFCHIYANYQKEAGLSTTDGMRTYGKRRVARRTRSDIIWKLRHREQFGNELRCVPIGR